MTVADRGIDTESARESAEHALSGSGADVETVTRTGRPTRAIVAEVDEADPDLIAMGVRGLGGIRRLVVGSTTAAIAGSVHRSLLVAHATEDES